jgi:hypothetical protein
VPNPIPVDQIADEFVRLRSERDETPAGFAAWAAFIALAEHPARAGDAAAGISEDLLMFDVSAEEGEQPNIRLVRIVGLEDADSDYVGSRALECVLVYDRAEKGPEVNSGTVNAWLYPDLGRADLTEFVAQASATGAFRVLLERLEPIEIGVQLTG